MCKKLTAIGMALMMILFVPLNGFTESTAGEADLIGKWKMAIVEMYELEISAENAGVAMMFEFKSDYSLILSMGNTAGEYEEAPASWTYDENNQRVMIDSVIALSIESKDGEYRLIMDGAVMGMDDARFIFTRAEDDASVVPDSPEGALTEMPARIKAAGESDFYGTWKLTYLDFGYSFRKTNAKQTQQFSLDGAVQITDYGTETYQTEYEDGVLYLVVPVDDSTSVRIATYLLEDGNIAQDLSAVAGDGVMGYFEKQPDAE